MRRSGGFGFTIIEILVVLGILAILFSIGIPNYLKSYQNAQVSQGTREFASQVEQVRAQARRTNRCFRFQVIGGTSGAYQVDKYKTSTCTGVASDIESTQTYSMAAGTQMTVVAVTTANTDRVDFRPPYGINATGLPADIQIASTANSSLKRDVRITGVMGTVIIK